MTQVIDAEIEVHEITPTQCYGGCGKIVFSPSHPWCRPCHERFNNYLGPKQIIAEKFVGFTEMRVPPAQIRDFNRLREGFKLIMAGGGRV